MAAFIQRRKPSFIGTASSSPSKTMPPFCIRNCFFKTAGIVIFNLPSAAANASSVAGFRQSGMNQLLHILRLCSSEGLRPLGCRNGIFFAIKCAFLLQQDLWNLTSMSMPNCADSAASVLTSSPLCQSHNK